MRKMFGFLALAATLVLLSACGGDSTGPKVPNLTGTWTGAGSGMTASVVLSETGGTVTGSGTMVGSSSVAVSVTGTHAHPNVSLSLHSTGFQDAVFIGTMPNDNTINGTLNGSGFSNVSLTLTR